MRHSPVEHSNEQPSVEHALRVSVHPPGASVATRTPLYKREGKKLAERYLSNETAIMAVAARLNTHALLAAEFAFSVFSGQQTGVTRPIPWHLHRLRSQRPAPLRSSAASSCSRGQQHSRPDSAARGRSGPLPRAGRPGQLAGPPRSCRPPPPPPPTSPRTRTGSGRHPTRAAPQSRCTPTSSGRRPSRSPTNTSTETSTSPRPSR